MARFSPYRERTRKINYQYYTSATIQESFEAY